MKRLLVCGVVGAIAIASVALIFSNPEVSLGDEESIDEGCFNGSCAVKWYYSNETEN